MNKQKFQYSKWQRRKKRVRKKVSGDSQRPRLTVFRSLRHVYVQIVDDDSGFTLAAASTLSDKPESGAAYGGNVDAAKHVGQAIAKKAMDVGIRQVRFDRNGYKYHGRVRALAEAARETGLVF